MKTINIEGNVFRFGPGFRSSFETADGDKYEFQYGPDLPRLDLMLRTLWDEGYPHLIRPLLHRLYRVVSTPAEDARIAARVQEWRAMMDPPRYA